MATITEDDINEARELMMDAAFQAALTRVMKAGPSASLVIQVDPDTGYPMFTVNVPPTAPSNIFDNMAEEINETASSNGFVGLQVVDNC